MDKLVLATELDKNLPNANIIITSPYYPGNRTMHDILPLHAMQCRQCMQCNTAHVSMLKSR
jgi:hypothetical protein